MERYSGGWNDPVRREGRRAVLRTGVNALIAIADIFPGIGDAPSLAADAAKVIYKIRGRTGMLDTTPDVGLGWALGTELLEIPTSGGAPTHIVEASLQYFGHDKEKIRKGRERRRAFRQQ